jgi:hypothetical protein
MISEVYHSGKYKIFMGLTGQEKYQRIIVNWSFGEYRKEMPILSDNNK